MKIITMRAYKNGLTLIELVITLVVLVLLLGTIVYVFTTVFISWSGQETRAGIDIVLDRAIEEMVRDLREAQEINLVINKDEIRFTDNEGGHYIYYLYNENDSYPSNFEQSFYKIKKAALTEGISGTFAYGAGRVIATDVTPPPASDLSIDDTGMMITIDLSMARGDEKIRSRTEVRPRNLEKVGDS